MRCRNPPSAIVEPAWRAGVPHSAFDDPTCSLGAPPRVSIEARFYAVYD